MKVVDGELAALIGFFQSFDAELCAERVRQPPRQHGTAHPVHDHDQVEDGLAPL